MARATRTGHTASERRCCAGLLAMWNHLHSTRAVEVDEDRDMGHRRLDFVAWNPETRRLLTVEHGTLHTFAQERRAERYIDRDVRPAIERGLLGLLQGHTRLHLLSDGGAVPREITRMILDEVRRAPSLLAPGNRRIVIDGRVVASVSVEIRAGRTPRLLVGPAVDASRPEVLDDLRARLAGLVEEEERKYRASGLFPAVAGAVQRLLLVEADDWWNLSDEVYANLFDAIAPEACRSGLAGIWRAVADSPDEVDFWQEWDAGAEVPHPRRYFRWLEKEGAVVAV